VCFVVLAVSTFCLSVVGPVTMIFLGTGRLRPLMATAFAGLAVNLLLSPLLASRLGLAGVLAGNLLGSGGVSLIYLAWTMRLPEFRLALPELLKQASGMVLAALLPGTLWTLIFWRQAEMPTWYTLGLVGVAAGGVFLAAALAYSAHRRVLGRAWQEVLSGLRGFSGRYSRA
jgi:O-antigen/teichoic acid export membrane protein